MQSGANETVTILLVDDDSIDAEAIRRAFRKARIANPIVSVADGLEALQRLRDTTARGVPRPYLVLLDLNMPRMNGIEFLEELRRDETLHNSVVFVLTTSDDDRDKVAAYDRHVAGYMVKNRAGEAFIDLIALLDHYWRIVELPPSE